MIKINKKRHRGRNFTEIDKKRLLKIISKYTDIVDNKKTDLVTVKAKSEAWDEIALQFNSSHADCSRTVYQIKNFFENHKMKLKKHIGEAHMTQYSLDTSDKQRLLKTVEKFETFVSEDVLWDMVTNEYSELSKVNRPPLCLKTFFKNHLEVVKKQLSADEKDGKETEGVPQREIKNEERMFIGNRFQFVPLQNSCDLVSHFLNEDDDIPTTSTADVSNTYEEDNSSDEHNSISGNCDNGLKSGSSSQEFTMQEGESNIKTRFKSRYKPLEAFKAKESFMDEHNRLKLEILKQELIHKSKEFEERMTNLQIEKQIKEQELRLITLKVEAQEIALNNLL